MSLFDHSDLPNGFACARSLTKENFRFPDLIDDLLRSVASSGHFNPPFFDPYTNIETGPILGGKSLTHVSFPTSLSLPLESVWLKVWFNCS